MQCRNVLTRIDAHRTGELEKKEEQQLQEHLQRCESCHDSVEDIEQLAVVAKALTARPPRSCLKKLNEEVGDNFDVLTHAGERVWVAFSDKGIRMIDLSAGSAEQFQRRYCARYGGRDLHQAPLPDSYRRQIIAALEGQAPSDPDVDVSGLTPFERTVLRTLCRIPCGMVRPYNWVARQVRRPRAVRAVGNVLAHNPVPLLFPCHRVVPASGGLGNYAFGVARKRAFLAREGAPVDELERQRKRA